MTDKPKVLDWHRAAAEEWHGVLRYQNRLAETIAAHDPHHLAYQTEMSLVAEVARLREALRHIESKYSDIVRIAAAALEGKDG